jgi:PAS domain S-box-containing protein
MSGSADFHDQYAAALRAYLAAKGEETLAVGHELGRRALTDQISMLEIIENHSHLVDGLAGDPDALQFLLQTLAALDVATRGFIDGTRKYEQQRARANDLADRDQFRTALVNSLQEGFFVADHTGAVIEINDAFADITGYGADGLPYAWRHPWMVDGGASEARLAQLIADGTLTAEVPIRHRDGRLVWVVLTVNAVTSRKAGSGAENTAGTYVGTIRDVTAARAAAERERAVVHLATAVGVARNIDEVLEATLDECRPTLGVGRVAAFAWPANDHDPAVHLAGTPATPTWRDLDAPLRRCLEDARSWLPLTVETVGWSDDPDPAHGIVATLSRDTTLWLEFGAPRRVSKEDRQLVIALVGHLSLAMQHVRQFELARDTSLTLQRSLLAPTDLPAGFAVRYEPAVSPLEIGGDWYDVLPVGDDRIGIIVGDCVGRGLAAAAVMGQLRSSARALLLTGASPARMLEQLDAVAAFIPDAFCTTVFVAMVDTAAETLTYSSAGHVPAVLAAPDAPPRLLAAAGSVPLAVQRDETRPEETTALTAGSTLLLYTDGLVERRDEPIDKGIARVADVLTATLEAHADDVAEALLERLAPAEGYDDDVALVLYRHRGLELVIEIDAIPVRLTDVRHQLGTWLRNAGVSESRAADIVLVVNEACSNSAEHAYRGQAAGTMRVRAAVEDRHIHVEVADSGSWKTPPPDPGTRGRGILLMRTLSEQVDLDGTAHGTTVGMRFRLG